LRRVERLCHGGIRGYQQPHIGVKGPSRKQEHLGPGYSRTSSWGVPRPHSLLLHPAPAALAARRDQDHDSSFCRRLLHEWGDDVLLPASWACSELTDVVFEPRPVRTPTGGYCCPPSSHALGAFTSLVKIVRSTSYKWRRRHPPIRHTRECFSRTSATQNSKARQALSLNVY
jgi:hypothetical protein